MTSNSNILDIWKFELRHGNSPSPKEGACLLDAVSWFEYGTLGDHPRCVCPVIAAFGRDINDAMSNTGRQRLKAFIPRLPGTVDPGAELERAEYLAWQAIRVFAPLALDAAGLSRNARALREFNGTLTGAAARADAAADAAAADATAATYAAAAAADAAARAADAAVTARAAAVAAAVAAAAATDAADAAVTARAAAVAAAVAAAAAARDGGVAARYAGWAIASMTSIENAMIDALNGALAIGRQAEPIAPVRWAAAQRTFAKAAGL